MSFDDNAYDVKLTEMRSVVYDWTRLYIGVDASSFFKEFRFDSDEHQGEDGVVKIGSERAIDGPVGFFAEYPDVEYGAHAVRVRLAAKTRYAEALLTLEDAMVLRSQLDEAIQEMELAEAIMADPGRMAEWKASGVASMAEFRERLLATLSLTS